ncbi:hypothetical protein NUM3379_14070 [Kineococcus sp. NUM-3379]
MSDTPQPATGTARPPAPSGPRLALTTAALTGLLAHLSLYTSGADDVSATVWWPSAGLALALAVRRSRSRAWVAAGTLAGTAVGTAAGGIDPAAAGAHALAAAAQCLAAGELVARTRTRTLLSRGRDAWLLGLAALVGVGCATAVLAALAPEVDLRGNALTQLLGLVLVTPLLLLAGSTSPAPRRAPHRPGTRDLEGLGALVACTGTAAVVFWSSGSTAWAFVIVVPVLWAAARTGPRRTLFGLLLVAVVACAGTEAGRGPYGHGQDPSLVTPTLQALLFTAGAVALVTSLVVRSRDRAVEQAQQREELFRRTFDDALLGVALLRLDRDGSAVVARVNTRLSAVLGGPGRIAPGSDWSEQVWPGHRATFARAVRALASGAESSWHAELRHGDGDTWLELAIATWPAPGGDEQHVAAVVQVIDCTQRRAAQRRLREAAVHDHLTGLPNRVLLEDRLRHALSAASRSGHQVALLYCDLDDFKPVNDTGGHAAGDQVLVETAARLGSAVRPGDTVARIGGDEFAVVCPDLPDEGAAYAVAQRVVEAMRAPFEVAGWSFGVGVSIGVALAEHTSEARRVLHDADEAMYRAKRSGKGRVRRSGVVDLRDDGQRTGT